MPGPNTMVIIWVVVSQSSTCLLLILKRVGGMVTVPSLVTVDREVSLDNFPFVSLLGHIGV